MKLYAVVVLCIGLAIPCCLSAEAQTSAIYVNGIVGKDINTGLSWGVPVKTINKGIQRAQEYNRHEVWVVATEYAECVAIENYCIELYGGFVGGETTRDERDWVNNVTTILGTCDDVRQKYCPCVSITLADNSKVDGFTLTGGGGTMGPDARYGGGIYVQMSNNVWIFNDIIVSNTAKHGGGVYAHSSGLWVKDCVIQDNTAMVEGGGIFMDDSDFMPKMEYTKLDNNLGSARGGNVLMANTSGGWIIYDEITNGHAVLGAGIACFAASGPWIREDKITGNNGGSGAGIYLDASAPETELNLISGNSASNDDAGGGIYCNNGSSPLIQYNRIKSNSGGARGGGFFIKASSPSVINNIIDYNTATAAGGGMAVETNSNITVTNNTFAWNEALTIIPGDPPLYTGVGGAIYINDGATVSAQNNIFYEDLGYSGAEVYVELGCTYNHDYNDYYNDRPTAINPILWCTDNPPLYHCPYGEHEWIVDPKFIDSDYHLQWDSFIIDKGNNDAPGVPGADYVDGDARKLDGDANGSVIVDIGADEYWPAVTSLGSAKGSADNTPVMLEPYIVTGAFPDYYYVEDQERVSGIRVYEKDHARGPGRVLRVYGRMKTSSDFERYIAAQSVEDMTGDEPRYLKPLALTNRSLGGGRYPTTGAYYQRGVYSWNNGKNVPPWAEAPGLNNIGLLVKTWGRVTWVNRDTAHPENEYFYIDDGSFRVDGTMHLRAAPDFYEPNFGIRVVLPNIALPMYIRENLRLTVSGLSSCIASGSDPVRLLRLREPGDAWPCWSP